MRSDVLTNRDLSMTKGDVLTDTEKGCLYAEHLMNIGAF